MVTVYRFCRGERKSRAATGRATAGSCGIVASIMRRFGPFIGTGKRMGRRDGGRTCRTLGWRIAGVQVKNLVTFLTVAVGT